MMLPIKRYAIKSEYLKPWIKFIWSFETDQYVLLKNKLLPTDSIDVLLNVSGKIKYLIDQKVYEPKEVHFNGIRHCHRWIVQEGVLKVFGISFFPYGLYPFINAPLSRLNNRIVNLSECNKSFTETLLGIDTSRMTAQEVVQRIEDILQAELDLKDVNVEHIRLIKAFGGSCYEKPVSSFCSEAGISIKTFERACLKYTGYSPKALQQIGRFQAASNQVIHHPENISFADLAYSNYYYDQSHFIKVFQKYSGVSPVRFIQEKITMKENTKIIWER